VAYQRGIILQRSSKVRQDFKLRAIKTNESYSQGIHQNFCYLFCTSRLNFHLRLCSFHVDWAF